MLSVSLAGWSPLLKPRYIPMLIVDLTLRFSKGVFTWLAPSEEALLVIKEIWNLSFEIPHKARTEKSPCANKDQIGLQSRTDVESRWTRLVVVKIFYRQTDRSFLYHLTYPILSASEKYDFEAFDQLVGSLDRVRRNDRGSIISPSASRIGKWRIFSNSSILGIKYFWFLSSTLANHFEAGLTRSSSSLSEKEISWTFERLILSAPANTLLQDNIIENMNHWNTYALHFLFQREAQRQWCFFSPGDRRKLDLIEKMKYRSNQFRTVSHHIKTIFLHLSRNFKDLTKTSRNSLL